jgi:hypothetical protein
MPDPEVGLTQDLPETGVPPVEVGLLTVRFLVIAALAIPAALTKA